MKKSTNSLVLHIKFISLPIDILRMKVFAIFAEEVTYRIGYSITVQIVDTNEYKI